MLHGIYAQSMTTLQIRDVPEELSRELKARAAAAGQSLSQFALAELTRAMRRPRVDLLWAQIDARVVDRLDHVGAAATVRADRDARP